MAAVEDEQESSSDTESQLSEEERAPLWIRFRWLRNLVIVTVYFAIGVFFVKWQERWGILTATYLIIQIVTTIGFGDVTVKQDSSQWFMIFYVFAGVLVTANIINDWIDRYLRLASEAMRRKLRRLEAHFLMREMRSDELVRERYGALNGMLVAGLVYFGFLAFGSIFYHLYESCTCSFGPSHQDGCVRGDQCWDTGGYRKDFREAIYMSVITLSTTGFGDYSPKTKVGRIVALFWMPLGVLSWVNFMTHVLLWWRARQKVEKSHTLLLDELRELDADGDGRITRAEFRVFFLLKEQIVKTQDIKEIDSFFASLDKEGRGFVTQEQMRRDFSNGRMKF